MSAENRYCEEVKDDAVRIVGAEGSPYSNKMLMYFRYKRINYRWLHRESPEAKGLENAKGPFLLPNIVFPDGSAMNDSTFLIRKFESENPLRSVYPKNEAFKFISDLLEDFADEYLTKCMYHYRWVHDPEFAGKMIALTALPNMPEEIAISMGSAFKDRQVGRLDVVGSNSVTGPIIESFYQSFLQKMDDHLKSGFAYLLGSRPSAADFAVLGQIHPMISLDKDTSNFTREISSRVCSWYAVSTDLSGYSVKYEDDGWIETIPPSLFEILKLVGKYYVPFLIANDAAYRRGDKTFAYVIEKGVVWKQPTFKYQSKCLEWLRESFDSLENKTKLIELLQGTGIEALFTVAQL